MVHTWRKQSTISPLKSDKGKNEWHVPIKKKLRAPSIKKSGTNTMHTFFNSKTSEFAGNLEGTLHEGTYRTTIQNMHKLGQKAQ